MQAWYVYILASQRNGTLYIGVTNNLARRIDEHRRGIYTSFTKKYKVYQLVYYEAHREPATAIHREKNLKVWKRNWKLQLIEGANPDWNNLSATLLD